MSPVRSAQKTESKQAAGELEQLILPSADDLRQIPEKTVKRDRLKASEDAWEERLSTFNHLDLEFIEKTSFKNTRAPATTLNDSMNRALDLNDPVARICAWARCKILRMPVAAYSEELGIAENTVRRLESTRFSRKARPEADMYSSIFTGWERLGAKSRDPDTISSLERARDELLSHLPGVNQSSSFGILTAWRYRAGTANFEQATGISYKAFWARVKNQQLYSFHEILAIGRELGMIPGKCTAQELQSLPTFQALERAWTRDCLRLGRARSTVRLHVLLALADIETGQQTLHIHPNIKLPLRASTCIGKFVPVPFSQLKPVLSFLYESGVVESPHSGALRSLARADMRRFSARYEPTLRRIAIERGMDNATIADAFNLRSGERKKAVLPVYRALNYGEYDRSTPPGAFALLLGRSESEAAALLAQKRAELRQDLTRKQSSIVSPVYVERMLWKVAYKDLPFEKAAIQELEWRPASAKLNAAEVLDAILQKGLEKANAVLVAWRSVNDYSTVSAAVASMLYHTPQNELQRQLGSAVNRLKNIAQGEECPPLPVLQAYLDSRGLPLTPRLERNWYSEFARHQCGENQTDLDRLITSYVASRAATLGEFYSVLDLAKQNGARILKGISVSGTVTEEDLETLSNKFQIHQETLFYRLLKCVQISGSIAEGLPGLISELRDAEDQESLDGIRELQLLIQRDTRAGNAERRGALSLGELMKFDNSADSSSTEAEIKAMNCLRALPGLTSREIINSTRPREAVRSPFRILIEDAEKIGITRQELAFALHKTMPVERQALHMTSSALDLGIASPLTAPGVMAQIVSRSSEELTQRLEECREHARQNLLAAGIAARPLQIEMQVWGVRSEDFTIDKRILWEAIWSRPHRDALVQRALKEVNALGIAKSATALDCLTFSREAFFTPQLSQLLMDRHPSGAMGLVTQAHLPFGAGIRYSEAREVPLRDQLSRMAGTTSFDLGAKHLLGWHFSMAEMLAAKIHNPVNRLVTHLALSLPLEIAPPEGNINFMLRAHRTLLEHLHLDTAENRAILRNADRNPAVHWKLTAEILQRLGNDQKSPLYDFALCLYLHGDVRSAMKDWAKGMSAYEAPFPDPAPLLKFCAEMAMVGQKVDQRLGVITFDQIVARKENVLAAERPEQEYQKLLDLAHMFYGARVSDLVSAPRDSLYHQTFNSLSQTASHLKPVGAPVMRGSQFDQAARRIKDAHDTALIERQRDQNNRLSIEKLLKSEELARQRDNDIELTAKKLAEQSGGKVSGPPSRSQINRWCQLMGDPDLALSYQSLYLVPGEAAARGEVPEVAFVRKFLELQEKRAARNKVTE